MLGVAWSRLAWSGLDGSRVIWVGLEWSGCVQNGVGGSRAVWGDLGWSGCVWTGPGVPGLILKVPKLWVLLIILSFLFPWAPQLFSRVLWGRGWYVGGCGGCGMRG